MFRPVDKPPELIHNKANVFEMGAENSDEGEFPGDEAGDLEISIDENELQVYICTICDRYDIDPSLVFAVIERESAFDAGAIGDDGTAFGLMQIQPKWHQDRMDRLGVTNLLDPYQNVVVGVDYLAELISCGKGLEWALMAYNGGPPYADEMVTAGKVSDHARDILSRVDELG